MAADEDSFGRAEPKFAKRLRNDQNYLNSKLIYIPGFIRVGHCYLLQLN